jgi:hypothetical protein
MDKRNRLPFLSIPPAGLLLVIAVNSVQIEIVALTGFGC